MSKARTAAAQRDRRHLRVRKKVSGTAARPRLVVFRSLKHIYAQLVDDVKNHTIATVGDLDIETMKKTEKATAVGKRIAERAKAAGVTQVVFDRAGYQYHGRVKAVAEGARKGGLEFYHGSESESGRRWRGTWSRRRWAGRPWWRSRTRRSGR